MEANLSFRKATAWTTILMITDSSGGFFFSVLRNWFTDRARVPVLSEQHDPPACHDICMSDVRSRFRLGKN
jgi:hypothetical protein